MTLIELVKDHVADNIESTQLEFGDNLFINHYPDEPGVILTLIDMGGFPPTQYFKTREKIIEFKFRTSNYINGNKLGDELFNLFHDKENYYLNENRIIHSYARTDVSYLYADNNDNEEFSLEVVFLMENNQQ